MNFQLFMAKTKNHRCEILRSKVSSSESEFHQHAIVEFHSCGLYFFRRDACRIAVVETDDLTHVRVH